MMALMDAVLVPVSGSLLELEIAPFLVVRNMEVSQFSCHQFPVVRQFFMGFRIESLQIKIGD